MFEILILTLISFVLYFFMVFAGYTLTETKYRLSNFKWLRFKPFTCCKCLTFWLISFCGAIMLVCGQTYIAILEFIYAAMTAIAMTVDERSNQMKIEEIKQLKEKENDRVDE